MQQNDVLFGIAVLPGNTKFAISFPGFSPTRPTKRGRVEENPGNKVAKFDLYSNTSVADRKFFLSCWLLKTYRLCTSQLTSVLFMYLKLEEYYFGKEFVTIFIALSFLSKLSRNSFFLHCRESRTIKSQLSASMKTNMHNTSKPVWWEIWS